MNQQSDNLKGGDELRNGNTVNIEAYSRLLEDKIVSLNAQLETIRPSLATLILGILLLIAGLFFGSFPLLFSDSFRNLIEASGKSTAMEWWAYTFTILGVITIVAAFRFLKMYSDLNEKRSITSGDLQRLKSIQIAWELSKGLPPTLGDAALKMFPMQRAQSQIIETLLST